ncbi:MAG: GNAT family N-acetyltransferase [Oscillospiraceae bacterium]|nr:GNAT family N-acetyltransferase [Oscillospiraceae bacterium]
MNIDEKAALALRSLADSCEVLAGLSGGARHKEFYDAFFVPETFWYNRVLLRPGGDGEALVGEISEDVKAGKLPPLLGWLDSDYPDAALFPVLKRAGYVPVTKQRAMYLSLAGRQPHETPFQVEAVPAGEIEAWSDMTARGFGKPPETGGMVLLAGAAAAEFLRWREGDETKGGVMLLCAADNGGIHEVSTLQEHRGRGIAAALMNRALDLAAERGCACATLQASELGLPLYRSLGFEDVGLIHNWILPPR